MNGLSHETDSVENLKSDYLLLRSNGSIIQNHNIVAKAYVPPPSTSSDKDYLLNEKRGLPYDWHKSPSAASSMTSDSGFQSMSMTNPLLNHSVNSAFSPRAQTKLNSTEHRLNSTEELDFSLPSDCDVDHESMPSTDLDHVNRVSSKLEDENRHDFIKDEMCGFNGVKPVPENPVISESRRRQRFRNRDEIAKEKVSDSYSVLKPSTRSRADALLKNFIEQAEERDRQARQEQGSLTRSGRPRTKSSSANKKGYGRSSSVDTDNRTASGLRRSNSSVDIQNIISKAETRDRRARVEQARIRGILPARRTSVETKQVRVLKFQTAATLIHKYEDKKQGDDPATRRGGHKNSFGYKDKRPVPDCQSEYAVPTHSIADNYVPYRTSRSAKAQKSPGSIHSDTGVSYSSARHISRYRERQRQQVHDSGSMNSISYNLLGRLVCFLSFESSSNFILF